MDILALIISIFKILGLFLLALLILILIIFFIILFSNASLDFALSFNNELKYIIKVKYLFGIIKYKYNYHKNEAEFKILGKNFIKNKDKSLKNDYNKNNELVYIKNIEDKDLKKAPYKHNKDLEKDINKAVKKDIKKEQLKKNTAYKNNKQNNKKNNKIFSLLKEIDNKKEIIDAFKSFLKKIIKAIKLKKLKINFELGLDDPAATGQLFGLISIFLALIKAKNSSINLKPNFNQEIYKGDLSFNIKTSLLRLIYPVCFFIFKKPIRKLLLKLFKKEN